MNLQVEEVRQYIEIESPTFQTLELLQEQVGLISLAEQGAPGIDGIDGDKNFTAVLSGETDITIAHNLGKYPSITVFDSAGDEVEGDYKHLDINHTRLLFSAGFGGKAIFN